MDDRDVRCACEEDTKDNKRRCEQHRELVLELGVAIPNRRKCHHNVRKALGEALTARLTTIEVLGPKEVEEAGTKEDEEDEPTDENQRLARRQRHLCITKRGALRRRVGKRSVTAHLDDVVIVIVIIIAIREIVMCRARGCTPWNLPSPAAALCGEIHDNAMNIPLDDEVEKLYE